MKKTLLLLAATLGFLVIVPPVRAQDPVTEAIKEASKKMIKAIDLAVQRLQNKTIWLQNAQKSIENMLSQLKLEEISDWMEKQRQQYDDYFTELWKVKSVIEYYHRVRDIMRRQVLIVDEYKRAMALFRTDAHFSRDELDYIEAVYSGILSASLENLDQLQLVIHSFTTQMSDARRMDIITRAGQAMDDNYQALQAFTNQNKLLSMQRARDAEEAAVLKAIYGMEK